MIKIRIVQMPPEADALAKKIEDILASWVSTSLKTMTGLDDDLENLEITIEPEIIKEEIRKILAEQGSAPEIHVWGDGTGYDRAILDQSIAAMGSVDPTYLKALNDKNIVKAIHIDNSMAKMAVAKTSRDGDDTFANRMVDVPLIGRLFGDVTDSKSSGYILLNISAFFDFFKEKFQELFKAYFKNQTQEHKQLLQEFIHRSSRWHLAIMLAHEIEHCKQYAEGKRPRINTFTRRMRTGTLQKKAKHYRENPGTLHGDDLHKMELESEAVAAEKVFIAKMLKNKTFIDEISDLKVRFEQLAANEPNLKANLRLYIDSILKSKLDYIHGLRNELPGMHTMSRAGQSAVMDQPEHGHSVGLEARKDSARKKYKDFTQKTDRPAAGLVHSRNSWDI